MAETAIWLANQAHGEFPRIEVRQTEDHEAWEVVLALGLRRPNYAAARRLADQLHDDLVAALRADLADDPLDLTS